MYGFLSFVLQCINPLSVLFKVNTMPCTEDSAWKVCNEGLKTSESHLTLCQFHSWKTPYGSEMNVFKVCDTEVEAFVTILNST